MEHGNFALVYSSMLRSSVWLETPETRCVWMTLLLLKDKNGFVAGGSMAGLAHIARVEQGDCEKALKIFMSADKNSSNPENRGKRIEKVDGGWQVLNHENYQFSTDAKRLAWAEHKRLQRERDKEKQAVRKSKNPPLRQTPNTDLAFEAAAMRAMERGDDETVDKLAATRKNGEPMA